MEETIASEVKKLREVLTSARQQQATGNLRGALEQVKGAKEKLDLIQSDAPETIELRSALYAEMALIHQRLRDARTALKFHQQAEEESRRLPMDQEGGEKYRLQLATTLINMTGLYAQQRMTDEGMAKAEEAISLLEGLSENHAKASRMLRIGAYQNQASLFLEKRDLSSAERVLTSLLELGTEVVAEGGTQLLPQLIESSGRLAALLRGRRDFEGAATVVERSERWAEAAYNADHPAGRALYVGTQLQMVDVRYAQLRFDQAEDHLWKAIDIAGDGRTLTIGTGFYLMLLRHSDELLNEGSLPKEEVVESLTELMERVVAAEDIPSELRELLAGRQAAVVERSATKAQAVYDGLVAAQSQFPGVVQVLPLLKNDIEWLAAGTPAVPHISKTQPAKSDA